MIADDLRHRLHEQRPFVPFTIRVADGRRFYIPTEAYAHVLPKGIGVAVWTNDYRQYVLPITQVSGVVIDSPESSEPAN